MTVEMNPMLAEVERLRQSCPLDLGTSGWTAISKREADAFDRVAGMPVDFAVHPGGPRRKTAVSPFHLLALLSGFASELGVPGIETTEYITMLNYGYDEVEWHSPVEPGVRIRDHVVLTEVIERRPGEFLMVQRHELEAEGVPDPVMTAMSPGFAILL